MMNKSKFNHLKSAIHKILSESIMRTYIFQNPKINDIDEIMRKHIIIYNKKHESYLVGCVLKILSTTNHVGHIRMKEKLNLEYFLFSLEFLYCLELIRIDITFLLSLNCIIL